MTARWRLTRAGLLAIVIAILMLAAGLMKTINLLILLGDLLLVLIALNAILAWRITRDVRLTAVEEPDHTAGVPSAHTLDVLNHGERDSIVALSQQFGDVYSSGSVRVFSRQRSSLRLAFTPRQRGVYAAVSRVGSGYPFGFVTHERIGLPDRTVIVGPRLGRLDLEEFRRWLRRGGTADARQRRHRQSLGAQAELRGVRPFRTGDSPRHVHWRTSARRNELMVREFDTPQAQDLVLVLDPWLPAVDVLNERERMEASIALAGTILQAWCGSDQSPRVTLAVPGRAEPLRGRASPALARRIQHWLAHLNGRDPWQFETLPAAASREVRLIVSNRSEGGATPAFLQDIGGTSGPRLTPETAPAWYHAPKPPEPADVV